MIKIIYIPQLFLLLTFALYSASGTDDPLLSSAAIPFPRNTTSSYPLLTEWTSLSIDHFPSKQEDHFASPFVEETLASPFVEETLAAPIRDFTTLPKPVETQSLEPEGVKGSARLKKLHNEGQKCEFLRYRIALNKKQFLYRAHSCKQRGMSTYSREMQNLQNKIDRDTRERALLNQQSILKRAGQSPAHWKTSNSQKTKHSQARLTPNEINLLRIMLQRNQSVAKWTEHIKKEKESERKLKSKKPSFSSAPLSGVLSELGSLLPPRSKE
ncbi:MAG: hypothetical protein OXC30_02715 [Alphaproteobacteria bacterium]|nr:hypothetical protein [Alphaproteobacteria bacterium]